MGIKISILMGAVVGWCFCSHNGWSVRVLYYVNDNPPAGSRLGLVGDMDRARMPVRYPSGFT